MIAEHTVFTITPGSESDFERAMDHAATIIARAHGFISLRLQRGIEQPSTYLLLVEWETVDDHMVSFRESELFSEVLALIRPHFGSPPQVEHFQAPSLSCQASRE
jgi:heme-degrading monooxygenase HmoA